jgi:hypothetical protein
LVTTAPVLAVAAVAAAAATGPKSKRRQQHHKIIDFRIARRVPTCMVRRKREAASKLGESGNKDD